MFSAVPPFMQGNRAQRVQLSYHISDKFDSLLASRSGDEVSVHAIIRCHPNFHFMRVICYFSFCGCECECRYNKSSAPHVTSVGYDPTIAGHSKITVP